MTSSLVPIFFFLSMCLMTTSTFSSIPGTTITILPTQLILPSTTLTRAAPATTVNGTIISFGLFALVIGTSTIPYLTPSPAVPVLTLTNQATLAAGPAGVILGDTGTTISNNGPDATIGGTEFSLGSQGLVVGGTSTLSIPTVQPLSSVFTVGDMAVTEELGQIVFQTATGTGNVSTMVATSGYVASTTGSANTSQPFLGAAKRRAGSGGMVAAAFAVGIALVGSLWL